MLNQHSKKHHRAGTPNVVPDPLVDPGNPSHRYQARSTAHLDRPCSRMVALAASSPGRRSPRSPQTKNATVMLGSKSRKRAKVRCWRILLQNPENAVRLISRQNSKRAPIANRNGVRFVTDLVHEFVARLCGPSRKRLIAAPAVRKICAQ